MPPTNMLSEERVHDTSDEDSPDEEVNQTSKIGSGSAKKTSQNKPSATDSGTDGSSSARSDELGNESDASDSSSKSSTSSASTGSKRKAVQTPKNATNPPNKRARMESAALRDRNNDDDRHNLANVKRVESTTYTPPQGYKANKMQSSEISAQAQSVFKDLDSKQVWHISAPSSFPISKLQSLNVQAALKGEPVLQHKGVSYTMISEDVGAAALLTPKPNGDYAQVAPVKRAFRISGKLGASTNSGDETIEGDESAQITQNDKYSIEQSKSNNFFATKPGRQKVPRKQPENLKARYVPYGVVVDASHLEGEEVTDPDVTMADVSPERSEPTETNSQVTPKSSKKAKTKKAQSPQVEVNETSAKRKKEKHVASSQGESVRLESSPKKKKRERSQK